MKLKHSRIALFINKIILFLVKSIMLITEQILCLGKLTKLFRTKLIQILGRIKFLFEKSMLLYKRTSFIF